MNNFDIRFTDRSHAASGVGVGEIQIDAFSERFESDLSSWGMRAYELQWETAALQVRLSDRAALITTFAPQSSANFVRCWAMYREGDRIFFQEKLLFLDRLGGSFDPNESGRYLGVRPLVSEDGEAISEWSAPVDAIGDFIARRRAK